MRILLLIISLTLSTSISYAQEVFDPENSSYIETIEKLELSISNLETDLIEMDESNGEIENNIILETNEELFLVKNDSQARDNIFLGGIVPFVNVPTTISDDFVYKPISILNGDSFSFFFFYKQNF